METFDDLKHLWEQNKGESDSHTLLDEKQLHGIVNTRTKKHMNAVMRYFWASFTLQLIVYALLAHVVVKYGSDRQTLVIGASGIALFIPFTIMLLRKFKAMAITRVQDGDSGISIHRYVEAQHVLLKSFYRFKKRYEVILVPLATAIGTFLTFKLYVPGGVFTYPSAALVIFGVSVISCALAIIAENKKSFEQPLTDLQKIMNELKK